MRDEIILLRPGKEHEQQAEAYIQEFIDNHSEINGAGGLQRYSGAYDAWLAYIRRNEHPETVDPDKVRGFAYFAVRPSDQRIVGMAAIRYELNDHLLKFGGHIGYAVRPTERRKGYATTMLRLALEKCAEQGIDKVLVTCKKGNIASAKVIQKNGGVLENELFEDEIGETMQRYWITLP